MCFDLFQEVVSPSYCEIANDLDGTEDRFGVCAYFI